MIFFAVHMCILVSHIKKKPNVNSPKNNEVLTDTPRKKAAVQIEMFQAIKAGVLAPREPRSPQNRPPASFEKFVQDVSMAAYPAKAPSA